MKNAILFSFTLLSMLACKDDPEPQPVEILNTVINPVGKYKGGFAVLDTSGYISAGSQALFFEVLTESESRIVIRQLTRANNFDFTGYYNILKNNSQGYWFANNGQVMIYPDRLEIEQCSELYQSCKLILWKQ